MDFIVPFLFVFLLDNMLTLTEARNETIVEVPLKKNSIWTWSWPKRWSQEKGADGRIFYYVCDVSPSSEPNKWMRSDVFLVGNAKRIDVTVRYAVSDCSNNPFNIKQCKQSLNLYVYKTSIKHGKTSISIPVPEPYKKPASYELFGSTSPTNLTTEDLSRNTTNRETYSFPANSTTPYYYLAIQYQGGCFALYSVTISYSVCPSLTLPTGLIQLPQTIAPVNGSIQVNGSCSANAQPLADDITLYGHCMANGEWSSQAMSGECWCKAGYGKYSNGSGAVCKACPSISYQDKPSSNACKPCPLNSKQDVDRTKCNCFSGFYRTEDQTIFDNCTGQPSAPQKVTAIFQNATVMSITWLAPLDLGGRSDEYYEVNCKKCDQQGKNCTSDCTGAVIIHSPSTSRQATVQKLSPYTYYQLKVFAKNGVSHLAEISGEKSKYARVVKRTNESRPGTLIITVKMLSESKVFLSWIVKESNGIIKYFQIVYFPVGEESNKRVLNTTENSITIDGLTNGKQYTFQVSASNSVGLSNPAKITQKVDFTDSEPRSAGPSPLVLGIAIAVPAVILLICIAIIIVLWKYRKKRRRREGSQNLIPMSSERLFIDPSNYNSPLEALRSNTKEIDLNDLELKVNIGEGEFADVYKAVLVTESGREVVAVKMLKPTTSTKNKKDFIREAAIMGQFKHQNVIELKGVVTLSPNSPMMIITELMENGSLENFLKSRDGTLTALQLIGIARGVANGMTYLTEMGFIHRDLAARNILVADNMASKISDFGLSRELDNSEENPESIYMTQGGKIPVRWTAPEAIRFRKYSSASDVWSFGILLWEIMAFGERPYWDWENEKVFTRVEEGFRLPPPMNCPTCVHDIMLDCWDKDMNSRPKFPDIVSRLDKLIRTPDQLSHQQARFPSGAQTNLGEVTTVEEWLIQINMRQYTEKFVNSGFTELDQVMALNEEGLKRIGITLIGHRNKINKSISELRKHYTQKPDFEIQI